MLGQDHENNVRDLINSRWLFRKLANYTESFGNGLLYLGTGLSTIATGVTILGSKESANTIQFISTACFAAHVTLIGFARCSAREEDQRESQLKSLADTVGFTVIPLEPKISDDEDLEKNSSQNK